MARPLPLGDALKALAASEPAALDPHPSLAVLVAYREGSLPEDEAEALRKHLVACHECAEQLLDLAAFEEGTPPLGDSPLSESDVAASWEKLKKRLPDGPTPARTLSFSRLPRYALPLAACLVLSVTFVAVRWVEHKRSLRNPLEVYFDLDQPQTRGTIPATEQPASRALAFRVREVPSDAARLRIRILWELDGDIVWTGKEKSRQGGLVELDTLPAKELPPGRYLVEIRRSGQEKPLGTFGLILS